MNKFAIKGKVTGVALKETRNGKTVAEINLECPGGYPQGSMQPVQMKAIGRTVELVRGLAAGDEIEVTGRIQGRAWNDRVFVELLMDSFSKVGGEAKAEREPGEDDDSIPF